MNSAQTVEQTARISFLDTFTTVISPSITSGSISAIVMLVMSIK